MLSRRQLDFTCKHWEAVLHLIGYLEASRDLVMKYAHEDEGIECHVDASLGMDAKYGHSISGYVVYIFGCPVVWKTRKQNHVTLSSAEAEFVAMSDACKELASLQFMCEDILKLQIVPVLFEDSKPAKRLAEVDKSSTLKHLVRLSYLYVREQFKNGRIKIDWVGTDMQVRYGLTKPLNQSKFQTFRDKLLSYLK